MLYFLKNQEWGYVLQGKKSRMFYSFIMCLSRLAFEGPLESLLPYSMGDCSTILRL